MMNLLQKLGLLPPSNGEHKAADRRHERTQEEQNDLRRRLRALKYEIDVLNRDLKE